MRLFAATAGVVLIALVLWDAFETIILARRVARKLRIARIFYRLTWAIWAALGRLARGGNPRENFLSIYGPLSLLLLLAIWAMVLVIGFGLLQWGMITAIATPDGPGDLFSYLYFSGTTFFTLGLGDIRAATRFGQTLTVLEAGTGFGFLAVIIAYLPGLSDAYSEREVHISLLDARAGSPPSAMELLRRHSAPAAANALDRLLEVWERWAADLLESHISFPVLGYFRSQHDNQSWLAALTAILDTCALLMAREDDAAWRARMTFAIARHAVVDICHILEQKKAGDGGARSIADLHLPDAAQGRLRDLERTYEPYCLALSRHLRMPLPAWAPPHGARDNWQGGATRDAYQEL